MIKRQLHNFRPGRKALSWLVPLQLRPPRCQARFLPAPEQRHTNLTQSRKDAKSPSNGLRIGRIAWRLCVNSIRSKALSPLRSASAVQEITSRASVRFRRFNQPSRQIPVSVHGAAQQNVITVCFVKEDVLLKWAKNDDEQPVAQTRMRKSGNRPKQRMLSEQLTAARWRSAISQFALTAYHSNWRSTSAMKSPDLRAFMRRRFWRAPARGWRRSRIL